RWTACGYGFRARGLRRPGMTEPGVFATTVRLLLRDARRRKVELRPERHWLGCAGATGVAAAWSHPPGGVLTSTATAGCLCGDQVCTACSATLNDGGSRREPSSSRFLTDSVSPVRAASANHLYASARFCSTPMPRA